MFTGIGPLTSGKKKHLLRRKPDVGIDEHEVGGIRKQKLSRQIGARVTSASPLRKLKSILSPRAWQPRCNAKIEET
ncbi:MAG: hypothetical protein ACLPJW_08435 [Rhodomicrobium sp.]